MISNVMTLYGGQAKIMADRGVAEATMTRWLYSLKGGIVVTEERDDSDSDVAESTRSYHGHNEYVPGRARYRIAYRERVSYEDIVWWLRMALKGNAGALAGTTTGSTPAGYTYTLTPSSTTDDLNTFTLKAGDPSRIYLFDRCAVNTLTISCDPTQNKNWMMDAQIFARAMTPGATFDGLSERARDLVKSQGTQFKIAAVGGSLVQMTNRFRSFSLTIDNQIEEKEFAEFVDSVAFDFARDEQLITGEVVLEANSDDEWANERAGTGRKLQFLANGPNIGATPTTDHKLQIDLPRVFWRPPAQGRAGTNAIETFGFVGYRNAASPQPITVVDVNDLATIAA